MLSSSGPFVDLLLIVNPLGEGAVPLNSPAPRKAEPSLTGFIVTDQKHGLHRRRRRATAARPLWESDPDKDDKRTSLQLCK